MSPLPGNAQGKTQDIPPGAYAVVEQGGTFNAVFNVDGNFYAL